MPDLFGQMRESCLESPIGGRGLDALSSERRACVVGRGFLLATLVNRKGAKLGKPLFSPDGGRVAVVSNERLYLIPVL
jgi:hypothetical protein